MYDYTRLFLRITAALSRSPGASLRKIAGELRVHPHTIALVVRRRTGLTYSAWRTARQLEIATRLLASRADLSIKEIGAAAGFSSTSVFDRFIRRRCGRSPTEWRVFAPGARRAGPNVNVLDHPSTFPRSHDTDPDATLISSTASSLFE